MYRHNALQQLPEIFAPKAAQEWERQVAAEAAAAAANTETSPSLPAESSSNIMATDGSKVGWMSLGSFP